MAHPLAPWPRPNEPSRHCCRPAMPSARRPNPENVPGRRWCRDQASPQQQPQPRVNFTSLQPAGAVHEGWGDRGRGMEVRRGLRSTPDPPPTPPSAARRGVQRAGCCAAAHALRAGLPKGTAPFAPAPPHKWRQAPPSRRRTPLIRGRSPPIRREARTWARRAWDRARPCRHSWLLTRTESLVAPHAASGRPLRAAGATGRARRADRRLRVTGTRPSSPRGAAGGGARARNSNTGRPRERADL